MHFSELAKYNSRKIENGFAEVILEIIDVNCYILNIIDGG